MSPIRRSCGVVIESGLPEKKGIEHLQHPAYSSDLAPLDYYSSYVDETLRTQVLFCFQTQPVMTRGWEH